MRLALALGISAVLLVCGVTEPAIAKRSHKKTATRHSGSKSVARSRTKRTRVAATPVRSARGKSGKRSSQTKKTTAKLQKVGTQKSAGKNEQVIEPPVAVGKDRVEADNVRSVLSRAYRLYDQGLNSRLNGASPTAVKQLDESRRLYEDARRYQSRGVPSTAEYLVHFEMGRAAEVAGDVSTARDSYARCLKVKPDFINASVHIITLLARNKQLPLALVWAKQAADKDPLEPRAHMLLALVLRKLGESQKADSEIQKAENLLAGKLGDTRPVDVAVPRPFQPESDISGEQTPPVNPFVSSRLQEDGRSEKLKQLVAARDKLMSSIAQSQLTTAASVKGVAIGPGTLRVFVDKFDDSETLPDSIDGVRLEFVVVSDKQ